MLPSKTPPLWSAKILSALNAFAISNISKPRNESCVRYDAGCNNVTLSSKSGAQSFCGPQPTKSTKTISRFRLPRTVLYAVHGQSHGQFSSGSLLAILLLQPFESPFSSHLSNKAGAFGLDVLILARQVHRVTVKVHVNAIELDSGLDGVFADHSRLIGCKQP